MTTEGWIFMVGFRVFDVGLLVVWLIWFFRLRDHAPLRPAPRRRGGDRTLPSPLPSRVRQPRSPVPAHRRG